MQENGKVILLAKPMKLSTEYSPEPLTTSNIWVHEIHNFIVIEVKQHFNGRTSREVIIRASYQDARRIAQAIFDLEMPTLKKYSVITPHGQDIVEAYYVEEIKNG